MGMLIFFGFRVLSSLICVSFLPVLFDLDVSIVNAMLQELVSLALTVFAI